jgi:hypothetical protein
MIFFLLFSGCALAVLAELAVKFVSEECFLPQDSVEGRVRTRGEHCLRERTSFSVFYAVPNCV